MAQFTVLNQDFYAIQGTQAKKNVIEIAVKQAHANAAIVVELLDKNSSPVMLNQVFSSFKTTLELPAGEDIGPVENARETSAFTIGEDGGIALSPDTPVNLVVESVVSDIAITGTYTVRVSVVDAEQVAPVAEEDLGNTNNSEGGATEESGSGEGATEEGTLTVEPETNLTVSYTVKVVTTEQALLNYENEIVRLSGEEITAIEQGYDNLEDMRKVVYAAITALENAEEKDPLLTRYYVAAENQYKAFKLIMEYKTLDHELELEKVTNVGGNMPFQITYNANQVKLGNATKAYIFYPAGYKAALNNVVGYPDDEPDDITNKLVPEQNTYLVSNENRVGGTFFLVFQINNIWYRTTYEVSENGTELIAVNEISTLVPEEGNEVILKKHTDKSGLEASIKTAEDLIAATTVGTNVGQASQEAIDAITAAVAKAKNVRDTVPGYTSYTDVDAFNALQKQLDDAKAELDAAIADFQEAIVSDADYAEAKLVDYEKAALEFFNSIRKKIRI